MTSTDPHAQDGERRDWQPRLRWFAAEIGVVVTGVLIALALNAWWGARQDRALETRSLRELRDALTNDLPDIRLNAGLHEQAEVSATLLRDLIRVRGSYNDTLDVHFGQVLLATYSVRDETAYETLKLRGLETVTNDSLRAAIGHLYGVAYPGLTPFQEFATGFFSHQQIPFYNQHFKDIRFPETATPIDYDVLLDSPEFAALMDWHIRMDAIQASVMRGLEEEVTNLIARLDAELARR